MLLAGAFRNMLLDGVFRNMFLAGVFSYLFLAGALKKIKNQTCFSSGIVKLS